MKGLILISGGFDSAVVAKIMKDKGLELKAIHFSYEPFTNNSPEIKSREICKILNIPFEVYNISKEIEKISKKCIHKYYFILTKRLMHKKAEEIAKKEKYDVLINGENIGQVGSQTIENLMSIDNAVRITILRPVLCLDKQEIIDKAREFGFYDLCSGPEVCDILGPKNPATKTKIEIIEKEEKKWMYT